MSLEEAISFTFGSPQDKRWQVYVKMKKTNMASLAGRVKTTTEHQKTLTLIKTVKTQFIDTEPFAIYWFVVTNGLPNNVS